MVVWWFVCVVCGGYVVVGVCVGDDCCDVVFCVCGGLV